MLKIRLQRIGKKNAPSFRVVVVEHTRGPKAGNYIERVGTYNPRTKEKSFNADRIKYWLSVGAQASDTVHNMLVNEKIINADKINALPKKTPIIKETPPEEETKETKEKKVEAESEPKDGEEENKETEEEKAEEKEEKSE